MWPTPRFDKPGVARHRFFAAVLFAVPCGEIQNFRDGFRFVGKLGLECSRCREPDAADALRANRDPHRRSEHRHARAHRAEGVCVSDTRRRISCPARLSRTPFGVLKPVPPTTPPVAPIIPPRSSILRSSDWRSARARRSPTSDQPRGFSRAPCLSAGCASQRWNRATTRDAQRKRNRNRERSPVSRASMATRKRRNFQRRVLTRSSAPKRCTGSTKNPRASNGGVSCGPTVAR